MKTKTINILPLIDALENHDPPMSKKLNEKISRYRTGYLDEDEEKEAINNQNFIVKFYNNRIDIESDDKELGFAYNSDDDNYLSIRETLNELMIDQLKQFLSERPSLSKSGVCREAGISTQHLNYILSGERSLTQSVKDKLIPVLKKYGYEN